MATAMKKKIAVLSMMKKCNINSFKDKYYHRLFLKRNRYGR